MNQGRYQPRPRRRSGISLVVASAIGLAISAAIVFALVRFAARNPEKANLGPTVLRFKAERIADEIDDRGPILFQDPLPHRDRDLYVQHLGRDPKRGWFAVVARVPDDPGCVVEWDRRRRQFVDCDDTAYGEDGRGLTTYTGVVRDGTVEIDLRNARS